ncbi:hypothetical protein RRV45_10685 [Bacillus sp. DTU_2020_1000418_1_SI_GHA_SEK_038]|uniref:hypothetical protein n=1 Tax=Bacillus sp. DTU_2020_1000418_1_SI_GHA_SEK_038 TaxID=3077585 RepID=UPI0028EFC52F|nr:hypothetical protein [Bacillus sp. DTU_2020_1000418_1_SI_GHA_SEK_038]WNS77420.1 hypothetical protein RRV45_10685 [Bacillus sp. DTU_2020_1000418_1_SI_GHA_SEK_038]
MSGPKHSQFYIEQERQKQLEQQRQRELEEERRRKEEIKRQKLKMRITILHKEIGRIKEEINETADRQSDTANQYGLTDSYTVNEIIELKNTLLNQMDDFLVEYDSNSMASLSECIVRMEQFTNNMLTKVNTQFEIIENKISLEIQGLERQKHAQSFLTEAGQIPAAQPKKYSIPSAPQKTPEKEIGSALNSLPETMEAAIAQLESYVPYFYHGVIDEVQNIYNSIHDVYYHKKFDNRYKRNQIKKLMSTFYARKKKYDQLIERIGHEHAEYEKLVIQYQTLCELLNAEQNSIYFSEDKAVISELKVQLEVEVAQLDKLHAEKQKSDYIVESINDVMEALGYDLFATEYMVKNFDNIHHQLYEIEDGAVNVFVSDSGSVLFEVSGISEGQKELTSMDKLKIKEGMEAFCTNYEDIKIELAKKGIYLTNENIKPADVKYARSVDICNKKILKKRKERRGQSAQSPTYNRINN